MSPTIWKNPQDLPSTKYTCGFCSMYVATTTGYVAWDKDDDGDVVGYAYVYICPHCRRATFIDFDGYQYPAPTFGNRLSSVPESVNFLYDEARSALSANCPTAAVMCCRKVLMHVAVELGADKKGLTFGKSVEFLRDKHYINERYKKWVDHIKDKGNDANHEIALVEQEEAARVLRFTEMLLKMIYEYAAELEGDEQTS